MTPRAVIRPVLLRTAVRTVALVVLDAVLLVASDRGALGDDPLGAGLVAFAAYVVAAGLWGTWDGARARSSFGATTVTWVVVGVLFALGTQVVRVAVWGPVGLDVVLSDLFLLTPTTTGLVVVPAVVGAALAASLRPGTRARGAAPATPRPGAGPGRPG